ncbi:O-antigen ligase family protein [Nocardioides salsibiostraticola]
MPVTAKARIESVVDPDRVRRSVVLALLMLAPLAWIPGGFTRFTFPKLLCVALAGLIAARLSRGGRLPPALIALTGAGFVVLALAAVFGPTPMASLVGRWPRYEGLPVLAIYVGAAWLGARSVGAAGRHLGVLNLWAAIASVALAAGSALEQLGVSPLGESSIDRPGSFLGNATDQGAVGLMLAAVLLSALLRPSVGEADRRWLLAGVVGGLATVAMSGSRTGIALSLIVVIVIPLLTSARRRAAQIIAVAAAALILLAVALPGTRERVLGTRTLEGRLIQWKLTGQLVRDHLVSGVGPSGYEDAFGRYESAQWLAWAGAGQVPDSPHSWLLQAAVAGGLPLLLLAVAMAAYVVVVGFQRLRAAPSLLGVYVAVLAYGVSLLINFTAAGPACLAAVLAGALLAAPETSSEARSGSDRVAYRPLVSGVSILALLFTGTASVAELELQRGVEAARQGDTAEATSAIASAGKWRPYDSDIEMIGAQAIAIAASNGDQDAAEEALRLAESSLSRTPDSCSALVAAGVSSLSLDRVEDARRHLDDAVTNCPMRPGAYIQRAIARFGMRDVTGARADLDRALELNPRSRVARRVAAEIDRRASRPTE